MALGLVPEFEEREAAAYTHTPWSVWLDMPIIERATGVAHYRLHHAVNRHVDDAVRRAEEQAKKRAAAK